MHHSFLLHYLTMSPSIGYAIAFFGMIFEGEIILFAVAFLARSGFVDFGGMLAAIVSGVVVGDLLWYAVGALIATRVQWVARMIRTVSRPFDGVLHTHLFRTILISKFVYNLSHLTIARAGMLGIPMRTFWKNDTPAVLLWVLVIGGLGYCSGAWFESVRHAVRYVEIGLLFGVLIFFLWWKYMTDFLKAWLK